MGGLWLGGGRMMMIIRCWGDGGGLCLRFEEWDRWLNVIVCMVGGIWYGEL